MKSLPFIPIDFGDDRIHQCAEGPVWPGCDCRAPTPGMQSAKLTPHFRF